MSEVLELSRTVQVNTQTLHKQRKYRESQTCRLETGSHRREGKCGGHNAAQALPLCMVITRGAHAASGFGDLLIG